MKNIIKLEEAAMLGISIYALYLLHAQWWWYLLMVFAPDISLIGYAVERRLGANLYNVVHHKGVAIFIFAIGLYTEDTTLQMIGVILFGHSSMDRILGFGLKLHRGFNYTHLGVIGGRKK